MERRTITLERNNRKGKVTLVAIIKAGKLQESAADDLSLKVVQPLAIRVLKREYVLDIAVPAVHVCSVGMRGLYLIHVSMQ